MADKNAVFLTRHIGNTTYKVRVYLSETTEETMEDKILRLIRNDGPANQPECGTIANSAKWQKKSYVSTV